MKKQLLIFTVAISATFLSTAQEDLRFGIKGGFNINSALTGGDFFKTPNINVKPILGLRLAGVADLSLSDDVFLRAELAISGKGYLEEEVIFSDLVFECKYSVTYLTIPLYLGFRSNDYRFGVGPYVGIPLSGKCTDEDGLTEKLRFGSKGFHDWSFLDFGLNVFASRIFGPIEAGLGAEVGIADMAPNAWRRPPPDDIHWRNFTISLFGIYWFN